MIRRAGLVGLVALFSCQNTESFDVSFVPPEEPNPFGGVDALQVWGVLGEGRIDLGRHRWDQGRFRLPLAPVEVRRLVFAGLAFDDAARTEAVLASGRTRLLDVLQAPPTSPIPVDFWATGRLNRVGELPWSEESWLASLGDAVLIAERSTACRDVATVVWEGGLRPGPVLPSAFGAGPTAVQVGGTTVLVGRSDCGGPNWAVLGPTADVLALHEAEVPLRSGAAVLVASPRRVLVAGGSEPSGIGSVEVFELDPVEGRDRPLGRLDQPRIDAQGALLTEDLVAFVGGRTRTATASALSTASFFSIGAGRAQGLGLQLPQPLPEPSLRRLASGSLLAAGADEAVLIAPELEPTRTATASLVLPGLVGERGELIDLGDGSLLWAPAEDSIQWLQLLPERVVDVDTRRSGPWRGASAGRGRALLADGRGRLWGFDAGPQGLLNEPPSLELLGPDVPLGLVPLRPGAWEALGSGVVGRAPSDFSVQSLPSERLLLDEQPRLDFELTVGLELGPRARASIVFGQVQEDFDYVVLGGSPQVIRAPRRQSSAPLGCAPGFSDVLGAQEGPTQVRLTRRSQGQEVALDVGVDGTEELVCSTPASRAGSISLAVIDGQVRFFSPTLR